MFGIGTGELLIILLVLFLLFGARRLPELGRGLGDGLRGFRDSLKGAPARSDPSTSADAAAQKPTEKKES